MRLVQVLIPTGTRASVLDALDDEGIDYAVFDETGRGEFEALVQFPIPPIGVEPVLERLSGAGVDEDAYTIVLTPETVVSRRLGALETRYSAKRISREELVARAEDLAPVASTYVAFLVLSTVIATTGLLLNSAATIIGAMVVAPLMGPAISASVGTVIGDNRLASRGVKLQVGGLLLAIATAAILGFFIKESVLVPPGLDIRQIPQIEERTSPNFLSLFLALGSGLAGGISVMRSAGSALVGVAIAVALVPPAATAGLGIAWGLPGVALAATVLVLVNMLAINVSALLLFWFSGFRPKTTEATQRARSAVVSRVAVLVVSIALLSIVLALVTYASFQTSLFEQQANAELQTMFAEPELADGGYTLADVTVTYRPADLLLGNPAHVTVLVGVPYGTVPPPNLADRIDERLTSGTNTDVTVRVGFVDAEYSSERIVDYTPTTVTADGRTVPSVG